MAEIKKIESLDEFNEFIKLNDGRLAVVKIGSTWCGPCRVLEGTINALTTEEVDGVLLGEINADDEWFEDLMTELRVRGIPALIAYKSGEEVDRIAGSTAKDKLLEFFGRNK